MNPMQRYPLGQIAIIKQKKLEESEKRLREKKALLEKEMVKLKEIEKERDDVKTHRMSKLTQLREKMDAGEPAHKIQQMRAYLKVVDEKLKIKESKVKEQQKHVDAATREVDNARNEFLQKQREVEKLRIHREEWEKEEKVVQEQKEGVESDEMGAILHARKTHSVHKRRKKE